MTDLEADPAVKVVVFQSANPDFFRIELRPVSPSPRADGRR